MSDSADKPTDDTAKPAAAPARTTGLSPKQQKLLAMQQKMLHQKAGGKGTPPVATAGFQGKSALGAKKTNFQRKAT